MSQWIRIVRGCTGGVRLVPFAARGCALPFRYNMSCGVRIDRYSVFCAGMMSKLSYFIAIICLCTAAHARRLTAEQSALDLEQRFAAVAKDNTVILTQTSCGYLEFAVNWITHAEALGITNWLTIAEDELALNYLNTR